MSDNGFNSCPECGGTNGVHDWDKHTGNTSINLEEGIRSVIAVLLVLAGASIMIPCPPIGAMIISAAIKIGKW